VRLTFSSDAVVVVAGIPGAGKTTLIRRAVDRSHARVIDTDDRRDTHDRHDTGAPRRRFAVPLYAGHYARIARAIAGRRPVVIHSRGTRTLARRAIAALARLCGREAHLVLIDADRAAAEAGQRARGRRVAPDVMDREVARWRRLQVRREPWQSVLVLDRPQAAAVEAIEFRRPAPAQTPVAAGTARSRVAA
jgi:predicted kinase